MHTKVNQWSALLLCCLPGVALVLLLGIGGAAFGATLNGPLGLGLLVLAALACPLSMGWMMWRAQNRHTTDNHSSFMANGCLPGQAVADWPPDVAIDRLAELRERRTALERELAELQQA